MQLSYRGQRIGTRSFSIHFAKIRIWEIETEEKKGEETERGRMGEEEKMLIKAGA